MKISRSLFFALSALGMLAVSAAAMPTADLRHLTAVPAFAVDAAFSTMEVSDQMTDLFVSQVMQIVLAALLLALVVFAIVPSIARRRRRTRDFDGGFFDAWRLPDQPPG